MLKRIKCDKFRNKELSFTNGLNVILGDDLATNSIGKTTALLIIDFVFGGSSYVKSNNDAIKNIGDHVFEFEFEFNDELFYFRRSTSSFNFVDVCDSNFEKQQEISLNEYKVFLRDNYNLKYLDNSFRSVVGCHSRVWGKDNYIVDKPLKQSESTKENSINNLIKLFDSYSTIRSLENQLKDAETKKQALSKAFSTELIPSINKTQYNKNIKELEILNKKIDEFKKNIKDISLDINSLISDEILDLRNRKNELFLKKKQIMNKIKRTEDNLKSDEIKVNSKLKKLSDFFPNINMDRLNEINEFHKKMSLSLKSELNEEIVKMKDIFDSIERDINLIEEEINSKLKISNVPDYNIERMTTLIAQKNNIEQMNKFYLKKEELRQSYSDISSILNVSKNEILSEIINKINIAMYENFYNIYNDKRLSPTFNNNMELKRLNDTGTGSSYINLISFDLAVFEKTKLPFLIHDSILFKNVEIPALENILKIYTSYSKQIFISLDEINKFSSDIKELVFDKTVVMLDKDHTLFEKNWKLKGDI